MHSIPSFFFSFFFWQDYFYLTVTHPHQFLFLRGGGGGGGTPALGQVHVLLLQEITTPNTIDSCTRN